MLTTTVDGLWVLQVLCGTEVLAPELGLRPHLPRVEKRAAALAHPMAAQLRRAGVITASGDVDGPVREWLAVLARREDALLLYAQHPGRAAPERVLMGRLARWWVVLERCDNVVRLGPAGVAIRDDDTGRVIGEQIDRLLGTMAAAELRPVTIDVERLAGAVSDERTLRLFLAEYRLDTDQVDTLTRAADPARCAQASLVAIQTGGIRSGATRHRIGPGVVTIIDTPQGRLLSEHVTRERRRWMIVGPGSPNSIAAAVQAMLRRLSSCPPTERSSR